MPRKRTLEEAAYELPIFNPESYPGKKEGPRNRAVAYSKKLVHVIPVIVLLSFSLLWCLSTPVKAKIRDGKIVSITPIQVSSMNDTKADQYSYPDIGHVELKAQFIHLSNTTAAMIPTGEVEEGPLVP
ncbi:hypothetical protein Syun_016014 [Stephania yunnanensis]|uniref:Uncharacterized protein n=1 Tax=Stephania yunnanensis TaxID=152371 RepID=A0AAP0J6L8_9MAGN